MNHKRKASGQTTRIVKGGSSDYAYRTLRDEIVSLSLEPGSDLEESNVVARLGLSRTPVREALVRLAGEGLVQLLPNRGARVSPMSWKDIRDHLEAFDMIQRLVTRWAAIRRTDADLVTIRAECEAFELAAAERLTDQMLESNWRFHAAIGKACENRTLAQFNIQLLTENLRISRLAMAYKSYPTEAAYLSHIQIIISEHRAMVAAIEENDADKAETLAKYHANLARKRVSETLTQSLMPMMDMSLVPHSEG